MNKARFSLLCSAIGLVLAILVSAPAYSAADEDGKLARYGQYGGPFSLVDQHGKTVTDRDFLGRYTLMFFGYTYCPDVCPTTMQVIGDALDALGEKGQNIQPVFVSVDPERDTPAELAIYLGHFHPRMIGLSGSKEQIVRLADDYGATYFKVYQGPSMGDDDNGGKGDYLINHSAAVYLMAPDGKFITFFPFGISSEAMAWEIEKILGAGAQ